MKTRPNRVLVVDDEPNIRYSVTEVLQSDDLKVSTAASGREGIDAVRSEMPDLVLMDVRLPDISGLDAFDIIRGIDPRLPVIIMTAFSRTETAIEAMRRGAFEYFVKPLDIGQLRQAVRRAIEVRRLSCVPAILPSETEGLGGEADLLVGDSPAMQEVYKSVGRVAQLDVPVLLLGESGTGKELVARALYHYSNRNKKPFLAVNCAALSESLMESELFGHEKGAFTGADQRRIGKFEQVNGGTIFLDEIGDMALATQAKALRLLQQQQFERVGGNVTIQTDVRIIAATNKNLEAMIADGTFREDLYYRLSGFTIRLPSLRDRREDIPQLVDYLIRKIGAEIGKPICQANQEFYSAVQSCDWPGNVRELHSAIRYALVQSTSQVLTEDCLPESCRKAIANSSSQGAPISVDPMECLSGYVRKLFESGQNGSRPLYGIEVALGSWNLV